MKTLFKNILVLAMVLGTCNSYANATTNQPIFNNVKKGDFISVTNASGEVIYSGLVKNTGNLKKLYDFSQLDNGVYTVEVNKAFEIKINSVEVKNNNVTFIENSKATIFKPVIKNEDSKVMISKLAIETKEMDVELYFENDLIHTETISGKTVLNRVYKLDQTVKGDYTAIIRANGRVYIENFRI